MANNSYPEELLALLQEYLTDGVITAKEREVLLKKAEKLGVDTDEFDLYIDAQVQEVDCGRTCPFCGGSVQDMNGKCPHCGETITTTAFIDMNEIIDELESALVTLKTDVSEDSIVEVERYLSKAKLYFSNNPKIKKLITEVDILIEDATTKAKEAKRNALIKKILTNKIFLWFAIVLIAVIVVWANTDNEENLSSAIFMTVLIVGIVAGGILNAIHVKKREKEEEERKERERREQMEHEERMARIKNGKE